MFPVKKLKDKEASIMPEPHDLEAVEFNLEPRSAGSNCHVACAGSCGTQSVPHQKEESHALLYLSCSQSSLKTHQNNGMSSQEGICIYSTENTGSF